MKGHGFRTYGTNNDVMILIVILCTESSNLVISNVDTLEQFVMNHSNDLDLPTRKVKVI